MIGESLASPGRGVGKMNIVGVGHVQLIKPADTIGTGRAVDPPVVESGVPSPPSNIRLAPVSNVISFSGSEYINRRTLPFTVQTTPPARRPTFFFLIATPRTGEYGLAARHST